MGIFGFLTLGTDEYSGNIGLKDQVLALQWIQDNIHHFGGDKNKVTIFGESSGGSSAHFHTLSPQSQNLFQRVIAQSGTAIMPFSYKDSPYNNVDLMYKFGRNEI